jgi:hypothetical protein
MNRTVLGIDVGYSPTRKTTGFCALQWDDQTIHWRCLNASRDDTGRLAVLHTLLPAEPRHVLALAIDGPLRPHLAEDTSQYRAAEAYLSSGRFQQRGKPSQTNAGSGPRLHQEATWLAHFAKRHVQVELPITGLIYPQAIVEAFPNLFLGVLCDESVYPAAPTSKRKWTDSLYLLVQSKLESLIRTLLPGRHITGRWTLSDHEEIAALTCALTALCVAAGRYTAVGSPADGYIILPPRAFWGTGRNHHPLPWAEQELQQAQARVRRRFPQAHYWETL